MSVHVSEKQFMHAVIDLARWAGWKVFHVYNSQRSPEGFCDLVMVRHATLLCIELKSQHGRVTPAQAAWLQALGAVTTVHAAVWRPADWAEIERQLLHRCKVEVSHVIAEANRCQ